MEVTTIETNYVQYPIFNHIGEKTYFKLSDLSKRPLGFNFLDEERTCLKIRDKGATDWLLLLNLITLGGSLYCGDIHLSDEFCYSLFELKIDIYGTSRDYIEIYRRYTIDKILSE